MEDENREPKVGTWSWWQANKDTPVTKPPADPVRFFCGTPREGYVYYLGDGNGRIKIGFSKNPWARAKEMKTANPTVEILAVEKGTMELERRRQWQFKGYHLALEWYKRTPELEKFIQGLQGK